MHSYPTKKNNQFFNYLFKSRKLIACAYGGGLGPYVGLNIQVKLTILQLKLGTEIGSHMFQYRKRHSFYNSVIKLFNNLTVTAKRARIPITRMMQLTRRRGHSCTPILKKIEIMIVIYIKQN